MPAHTIATAFQRYFGYAAPLVVRSPSRFSLLGEHTYHQHGSVLPVAIDQELVFAVGLNGSSEIRLVSHDHNDGCCISLDQPYVTEAAWINCLLGVVVQLQEHGIVLTGFDCVFGSNTHPRPSRATSTAAIASGLAFALNELLGTRLPPLTLAHIAQSAEQEHAGLPTTLPEQFASLFSRAAHITHLDHRSLVHEFFPFDMQGGTLLLCNTGIPFQLTATEHSLRQQQCQQGLAVLRQHYPALQCLRDVTPTQLACHQHELPESVFRCCRHIIEEHARVVQARQLLEQGALPAFGQLLYASHRSLRDDYQASSPEQDALVAAAQKQLGVLGARALSGSFAGYTLNLVLPDYASAIADEICAYHQAQFGQLPDVFAVRLAPGVSVISEHTIDNIGS